MDLSSALLTAACFFDREVREELRLCRREAATVDEDPAAFPLAPPRVTIVRVLRHAIALTGYTTEDLDRIFSQRPGTTAAVIAGKNVMYLYGAGLVHFINISRRVTVACPDVTVRDWWEKPRPRRKLAPLDLLRRGQANRAPFAPYHAELQAAGVVSQILPTAGSAIWIEMQLAFTAPQPSGSRSR